ncbi:hypothetical protein SDC9_165422 [bioreactor metagenome]|uniref:Uncharacterized protein n=1 Tax=bioreactor metagenome TaxID=1076179 RepID=A0A645G1Q4_9ZZZZ
MQHRVHDLRAVQRDRLFLEQLDGVVEGLEERRPHPALHPGGNHPVSPHEQRAAQRREEQNQRGIDVPVAADFGNLTQDLIHNPEHSILLHCGDGVAD